MQSNPIERQSTLKLIFGKSSAWQIQGNRPVELDSIFSAKTANSRSSTYAGDRFAQSQFWKSLTSRYYQYDDFNFKGIAAASYLMNAHRFKIWFNPFEFYEFIYKSLVMDYKIFTKVKKKEDYEKVKKEYEDAWQDILTGKNKDKLNQLTSQGFEIGLYNRLQECVKQRGWDFASWVAWNTAIVNNPIIAQNLESVMVHEMMHIILNHLARRADGEDRDAQQFNIAADYAINQTLNFSQHIRKMCITEDNEQFWDRFTIGIIKHLIINDEAANKELKKSFKVDENTDFSKLPESTLKKISETFIYENSYYGFSRSHHQTHKFSHKTAEFYYKLLLETCVFIDPSQVSGYDSHEKWGEEQDSESDEGLEEGEGGEGDKEGKGKGKGKGKGAADGTEECKESDGKGPDWHPDTAHDKKRGKGGRQEHQGFDPMEAASTRTESKASVKDALERSGVDIDDPAEIEKALNATPGLNILGAQVMEWFKIRTQSWQQILKSELTKNIGNKGWEETLNREHRALPGVFPGKKRLRTLRIALVLDTSGSINYKDWNAFIHECIEIGKSCDIDKVRAIQCHSVVSVDEVVSLKRLKNWRLKETGGTTMKVALERLKRTKNKDTVIMCTDGFIDTFYANEFPFKVIMLLSSGNECNKESLESRGFKVITQKAD